MHATTAPKMIDAGVTRMIMTKPRRGASGSAASGSDKDAGDDGDQNLPPLAPPLGGRKTGSTQADILRCRPRPTG